MMLEFDINDVDCLKQLIVFLLSEHVPHEGKTMRWEVVLHGNHGKTIDVRDLPNGLIYVFVKE